MPTSVLCVCTGNVCRSPALQRLLETYGDGSVNVSSAGVSALVGEPMAPHTAELLEQQGIDVAGIRGRQLTATMIEDATVIITMTQRQRSAVVRLVPSAVRRTFTLLELAALLHGAGGLNAGPSDATRWAAVPRLANTRRTAVRSAMLDVPDPWNQPPRVHRRSLVAIVAAVRVIAEALALGQERSPAALPPDSVPPTHLPEDDADRRRARPVLPVREGTPRSAVDQPRTGFPPTRDHGHSAYPPTQALPLATLVNAIKPLDEEPDAGQADRQERAAAISVDPPGPAPGEVAGPAAAPQ